MNRFIRLRAALSFNTNRLKSRKYKSGNIFDVAGAAVIFLRRDKNYLTQRIAARIFTALYDCVIMPSLMTGVKL